MTTFSIYQKTCPECAAVLPADDDVCSCGYGFTDDGDQSVSDQDTQAAEDGHLYAAYLAARLTQALETMQTAQSDLAADPENFNKALRVMQTVHSLKEIQAEHNLLTAKLAETQTAEETSPSFSTQPSEEFNKQQATKATEIMETNQAGASKTCPECAATVPANHTVCTCGYVFVYSYQAGEDGVQVSGDAPFRGGVNEDK